MINLENISQDCNVEESNSDNVVGEYEHTVENEIGIKDCATVNDGVFEEDGDIVPEVGMKFRSVDEIYEIYKKYAYRVGFPIRRRSSRKGKNGVIRNVAFTCGREGNRSRGATTSLKPSATSQTGCKARLNATADAFGVWRVTTVELQHNHEISPSKSRMYRCNRQLTENVKRKIELNDTAGIPLHKSYNSIVVEAGGYENMTFIEKDCRNFIDKVRRLRLGKGDAIAIHAYFAKKTNQSHGFYFSIDYDEDGRLKNVFWADNRCRLAYKEFGDAVTFDTTYLTNKYDMPFAPFVGVNHHGQSTLLGCGLIGGEDTDTFVWLFKAWLDCMDNKPPKGIITDQDRAMQNAIEIVFPNTRHRWCLWHILRKLPEKFGYHKEKYSIFKDIHNSTYESLNPEEFVQSWVAMVDKYTLHENDWLSGIFKERSWWVPCFVNTSFWAGISSTQRSESMNAFFDGYVHSKTSLKQFVEQYERALRSKVDKEFQADFRSFSQMIPCVSAYDIEKQFQASYTMDKFIEFQEEITRLMYCKVICGLEESKGTKFKVCEDVEFKGKIIKQRTVDVQFEIEQCEIVCSCHSFEFRGILCRHAVLVLLCKDVRSVPQKYILRRWKRDANRLYTWVKVNYDGWITTPGHEI